MLPLVTSQAIALSKAKQGEAKSPPASASAKSVTAQPPSEAPTGAGLLRKVHDVLTATITRRARKTR
jgi:hypothetical protein